MIDFDPFLHAQYVVRLLYKRMQYFTSISQDASKNNHSLIEFELKFNRLPLSLDRTLFVIFLMSAIKSSSCCLTTAKKKHCQ